MKGASSCIARRFEACNAPPKPAIAAANVNTDNLSRSMLSPKVALAAGLSFIADSWRP